MSDRRELIFGFVLPLGIDKDLVEDCLRTALCAADYAVDRVRVSHKLDEFASEPQPNESYLKRKERLMDAGDNMRQHYSAYANKDRSENLKKDRGDAVALASISEIRQMREKANLAKLEVPAESPAREDFIEQHGNTPRQSIAYLIDSLKHPDELQLLKRTYGPAFVSIGVYSPPEKRKAFLLKKQGAKDHSATKLVDDLMRRDETGEDVSRAKIRLGQDVSDAFFVTDFIVDATKEKHEIAQQFTRLIELLFGDVYQTPTMDEIGMFLARGIQVRSGSLARQIGASILRSDGSVVGVGTNEAARPISGGQYWPDDDHSYGGRDMVYRPTDTSDEFRAEMLSDLLDRLDAAGALSQDFSAAPPPGSSEDEDERRKSRLERLYFDKAGPLRKARLRDNIDYVRAVHAEGAAIIDAARHGVATKKCTMFTTTFPCHECARHIVAAGIKEVVYLEPYPKSAVRVLYEDSIQVDPHHKDKRKVTFRTFVGVSPSRYLEFFTVDRDRKDAHGQRVNFDFRKIPPHLPDHTPPASAAVNTEFFELQNFTEFLAARKDGGA